MDFVYQSLLKRDKEKASYFLQPQMAEVWVRAIVTDIANWIYSESGKKWLWEVVRFVSWRIGVIDQKLSREKFANLVFVFCRGALKKDETASKIKASMEQCKFIKKMKEAEYKKLGESHELKGYVAKIEGFFNKATSEIQSAPHSPIIEDRLETYLRNTFDEDSKQMPCSRLRINHDYGDNITPTFAVEKYNNNKFLNLGTPSYIEAYQCIPCALDIHRLREFLSIYEGKRHIKLYIVSTSGLANDVYSLAQQKGIGYIQINPKKEMTSDSYVLPRSIEDSSMVNHYMDILMGQTKIDVPLIIWDGEYITTSIADMLTRHNVPVNHLHEIKAPYLKYEEIDALADGLTKEHVEECGKLLKKNNGFLCVEDSLLINSRAGGRSYVERIHVNKMIIRN